MFFRCGVPTDGEVRRQILEHFARERPDDIHPLGGDSPLLVRHVGSHVAGRRVLDSAAGTSSHPLLRHD